MAVTITQKHIHCIEKRLEWRVGGLFWRTAHESNSMDSAPRMRNKHKGTHTVHTSTLNGIPKMADNEPNKLHECFNPLRHGEKIERAGDREKEKVR